MNGNGLTLREVVYDLLDDGRRAGDFPLARDSIDRIAAGLIDTLNDRGVPTRYWTGGSAPRISASTTSVGMPRSINQMRLAFPYCRSIRARKSRKVVLSAVLPGSTS